MVLAVHPHVIADVERRLADESNNADYFQKEARHDQWLVLLEGFQLFILLLLITLITEGLVAAVVLYHRSKKIVGGPDTANSTSTEGLSPPILESSNLYPILELAGENRSWYLKPLESKKFRAAKSADESFRAEEGSIDLSNSNNNTDRDKAPINNDHLKTDCAKPGL